MKTKRILSILLSFTIILSTMCTGVFAMDDTKNTVPQIVHMYEKIRGSVISFFADIINNIVGTDETAIPHTDIRSPSYTECDGGDEVTNPEQTINTETWVCVEISYQSEKSYQDPFNDVDIDIILCGNGISLTIPGFWDGGNTWKIRLACPSVGEWYFRTVCTDEENTSLHNRTGKIVCSPYSGDLDIYKHGFVTANNGKKYFTYADGVPFFYLGDTHWSLGDETADMVKTICEKRVSQGFTVYQSEPIGEKFDFADGITETDMMGLHNYDEKFKIIAENGLVHANAEFFFPASMELLIANFGGYSDKKLSALYESQRIEVSELADSVKVYLEKISRFWVARYGAYPVMWTLGQEVDNDFYWNETSHPGWNFINNPYKLVADYIEKYDVYDHPLTAHQENVSHTVAYGNGENASEHCKVYKSGSVPSCFRDVSSHSFYAAQWSPSKTSQTYFDIEKDYWYNSQGKPVINYEGQYCYLWTKNYGARMQGWLAYLNGMYGYGWGGHDTWSYLNIYNEDEDSSDGVDTITSEEKINATWQDSLEYASSYQMGYMRSFFSRISWQELIPRFDNRSYFVPCSNVYYAYAGNKDNTEIVIYLYSFTDETTAEKVNTKLYGGVLSGTVASLIPEAKYSCQWFDPTTGEYYEESTFTASRAGTHYIGERPTAHDMVLLIKLIP
ncbi:MAG: DUF4038 domain-containing protein [Clostridia bacterium]|nr:DUF4038 domain-containing protein [Clostridia bacterium]